MTGGKATRVVVLEDGTPRRVPAHQHVPHENVRRGDMAEWKQDLERRRARASAGLLQRIFGSTGNEA